MSAYRQLVAAGELGDPTNHDERRRSLPRRDIRDGSSEGNAKLRALRRFVAGASFAEYSDDVDEDGEPCGTGILIFLPLELPGWGYFVTTEAFKIKTGLHRFVCKCGLANPPFLEMRQSAFCDKSGIHYANSAAHVWYKVHAKRQEVYGPEGFEAPEWDPFPDGRGVIPRVDSERESNEQRQMRESRWSARRSTDRHLPQEALQTGAWLPICHVPCGPAFKERSTWTLEQEQKWNETVEREKQDRETRRAAMEVEVERQQWLGVRRLFMETFGAHIGGGYPDPASMSTAETASPSSGASASSSQPAGLSSKTSAETLATDMAQQPGCEAGRSEDPAPGEQWYTTPTKDKRPLKIVDPANKL